MTDTIKKQPLISVCIPAYKRISFLERLLDSIDIQSFRDFEVVVTDDSPDGQVQALCEKYTGRFPLFYYRHATPLGTPENWNDGIRYAGGKWIKLMHDDDWFVDGSSLQGFADAIASNKGDFYFSAYNNVHLDTGRTEFVALNKGRMKAFLKEPATLFSRNIIGPPSVILHRNDRHFFYDNTTKWVVDIDFYIRRLAVEKISHIDRPLINVGVSDQQVTVDCKGNRKVQLPENFYLLYKIGTRCLRNVLVYDAWWRLVRNLELQYESEIREAGYEGPVHPVILSMIHWQQKIPRSVLTTGVCSKAIMFLHFLLHRSKI